MQDANLGATMRRHAILSAGLTLVLAGASCSDDGRPPVDPPDGDLELRLAPVAAGLSFPLALTAPPGDARLFIVEKPGRIRIVENGALVAQPFLDISAKVSNGSEQGLLGLAFHPQYATNGRFFVDYTDTQGDTRIAAYRVSADRSIADAASEEILLTVDQPYSNHNGGHLAFGPDGFLYVAMGDGGSGGDPDGNGQDRTDLLGSLLRLDVNGASGYVIPADNPFVGTAGFRGELWDYGLRNPWRFSFDRETGDLYIADVGQNAIEEINVATSAAGRGRGLNYGWNRMEGTDCFSGAGCNDGGLTLPVHEYGHSDGCSVTGGHVYRGQAIAGLRGTYFYADFCSGWVRSFVYAGGRATDHREWPSLELGSIPGFGEDAAGELYILDADGRVMKVVPQEEE